MSRVWLWFGVVWALAAGPLLPAEVEVFAIYACPAPAEGSSEEPLVARLAVYPVEAASTASERVEVELRVPGSQILKLPDAPRLEARLEAPGYWTPTLEIKGTGEAGPLTFPLFRTGELRARVSVPRGESAPAAVSVRITPVAEFLRKEEPLAGCTELPEISASCPVEDGALRCTVPAGAMDLRVSAEGFASVYRWGVGLAPGEIANLAPFSLQRGGSVVGRVKLPERHAAEELRIEEARVELRPSLAAPPDRFDTAQRLETMVLKATPGERGHFQFNGVPPGRYQVVASHPELASARMEVPRELVGDLEVVLEEPLVLRPLARLRVALEPVVDPYGEPWELELYPAGRAGDGGTRGGREATASPEGRWMAEGLEPGHYWIGVSDSSGSRWATERIEIMGPQERYFLEMAVLEVAGSVRLGEERVQGQLWFGGRHGGRAVRLRADEEGEFEGYLPEGGRWRVEMEPSGESIRGGLPPVSVDVEPLPGEDRAIVEIVFPDTRVEGTVTDETGSPVEGAVVEVTVLGEQGMTVTRSDAEGHFQALGFEAGMVSLRAHKEQRSSDTVLVPVTEDGGAPPQNLVIQPRMVLSGAVRSATAYLPGARVLAWADLLFSAGGNVEQTITGPGGYFELEIRATAVWVNLIVSAPGHAIRVLRAPADPGRELDIVLDQQPGTLVLDLGEPPEPGARASAARQFLIHDGAFVPLSFLRILVRSQRHNPVPSGRVELTNLESGTYSLCTGGLDALHQGEALPEERCSTAYLPPFGEVVLSPVMEAQAPPPPPPGDEAR